MAQRSRGLKLPLLWYFGVIWLGAMMFDTLMGDQVNDRLVQQTSLPLSSSSSSESNDLLTLSVRNLATVGTQGTFQFNVITTILGIVIVLITLTIIFEEAKDYVEETTTSNMRLIADKLFGEITVLGFLSMFTFAFSKSGLFTTLSVLIFQETSTLALIFEKVHYTIFFIMILFVFQVLILMNGAMKTEEEWLQMERKVRNPERAKLMEERARQYYEEQSPAQNFCWELLSLLPGMRGANLELHENEILFKALRDEFILERSVDPPFAPALKEHRLDDGFNFGRYLGMNLGQMCAQIVNLNISAWTFFMGMSILYWGFVLWVQNDVVVLAWTWVVMAWLQYLYNLYFERHLIHVRRAFAHKELFHAVRLRRQSKLSNARGSVAMGWVSTTADETTFLKQEIGEENGALPLWTEADVDAYMRTRSWLATCMVGGRPNRQQTFYWMDARGPRFYPFVLQVNLIFIGVFVSMNYLSFVGHMYRYQSLPVFILYCIFAFLPLAGVMFFKRNMIAAMSTVCCLGVYRRHDIVAKVLREEKTILVVRAFLIIYKLRKLALSLAEGDDYVFQKHDAIPIQFDDFELNEVGKTFDAFDSSGDGNISFDEFEALMKNVGAELTPESLRRMMDLLDDDGNEQVNRDEFISWYAKNAGNDETTIEERAGILFSLFDDDNSGSLTIGEFKQRLDALRIGFTVDDIGAIVNELDQDKNGSIGPEEFARLIEKHYPKEMRPRAQRNGSAN